MWCRWFNVSLFFGIEGFPAFGLVLLLNHWFSGETIEPTQIIPNLCNQGWQWYHDFDPLPLFQISELKVLLSRIYTFKCGYGSWRVSVNTSTVNRPISAQEKRQAAKVDASTEAHRGWIQCSELVHVFTINHHKSPYHTRQKLCFYMFFCLEVLELNVIFCAWWGLFDICHCSSGR